MKISFVYNKESELRRVAETVANKDFFLKYNYGVLLPKYTNFDNFKDFSKEEISKKIEEEMGYEKFTEISKNIHNKWEIHKENLIKFFLTLNHNLPSEFIITFTKYGTGGDYDPPNKITINLRNTMHTPFQTLVHEIIHCLIEDSIVLKYKLTQAEKESVVDWLMVNNPLVLTAVPSEGYQFEPPSEELLKKVGLT